MNKNNTNLLDAFYTQEMSKNQVKMNFDLEGKSEFDFILNELNKARKDRSPDMLEDAVTLLFIFDGVNHPTNELNELLLEPWHYKHEDIASLLQDAKSPSSADFLYRATIKEFDYLSFDDSYALAIKCIWALGEIDSPQAIDNLVKLSKSNNHKISNNALNQLKKRQVL